MVARMHNVLAVLLACSVSECFVATDYPRFPCDRTSVRILIIWKPIRNTQL
ncbi:hypothetical protein M758_1G204800 [Ceratodon purpureus]|uniref:Uncharacterized protein n=1 Tax=Ceratodon purpureus TaxID=3225 RepID=A0A8T0J8I2_CERPU|nr:hypothetical protein KC19_1G216000 [Ceratodon purpureus]KAG0630800.1 hypothetical protein M758_1G204800 [Ceratodon purpureus]